jgi:hypothetical protein
MILYVETNFIVGGARGQVDAFADELVEMPADMLRIALPASCVVEALYAIQRIGEQHREFSAKLESELVQLRRDSTDPGAGIAYARLEQGSLAFAGVFNTIQVRALDLVRELAGLPHGPVRCEVLPLDRAVLVSALHSAEAVEQLTGKPPLKRDDWLIAAVILDHASRHVSEPKGFLSSNSRDFGKILGDFRSAGIVYFTKAEDAVGWVRAGTA